jgi:adenylosuccinate lyase
VFAEGVYDITPDLHLTLGVRYSDEEKELDYLNLGTMATGNESDSCIALDHMLRRFTRIVRGLVVNADRMKQNLEMSRGVVFSGTVLLELAQRGVAREQAYEWVQRNALRSHDEQKDFKQLLLADADVMGVLDRQTVEDAFDLKVQLKNVDHIVDRVFETPVAAGVS